MRPILALLGIVSLSACDKQKARDLGREYGRQSEPFSHRLVKVSEGAAEFLVGSMEGTGEASKARAEKQAGKPVETFDQMIERQRRARDKGFPGHHPDAGFPGFRK